MRYPSPKMLCLQTQTTEVSDVKLKSIMYQLVYNHALVHIKNALTTVDLLT